MDIGGAAKLDSYVVYVGSSSVATVDADVLTYTLDGLAVTAGQSYSVRVSALTAIGEGALSDPLTIWAVDLPEAPIMSRTDTSRESCSV